MTHQDYSVRTFSIRLEKFVKVVGLIPYRLGGFSRVLSWINSGVHLGNAAMTDVGKLDFLKAQAECARTNAAAARNSVQKEAFLRLAESLEQFLDAIEKLKSTP
jgi:hypothetical protein